MRSILCRAHVKKGTASLTLLFFTLALLHGVLFPSPAQAADPQELLAAARSDVEFADYEVGLQKARTALEMDLTAEQRREASVLVARCEAGLGQRAAAVEAFYLVLRADPTWRPDPVFYRQDEIDMFEEAQRTFERTEKPSFLPPPESQEPDERPWYKKPKYLGGLGAFLVGGIVFAVAGGGDDGGGGGENDLPSFPPHP